VAWYNIGKKKKGDVPTERKSQSNKQVINQAVVEYLSEKIGKDSDIVNGLKTGFLDISAPKSYELITKHCGGLERVPRLQAFHGMAQIVEASAKFDQARKMAGELVEYATSSSIEKKKFLKEIDGGLGSRELTTEEMAEVTSRHENGIKGLRDKYIAMRVEVAEIDKSHPDIKGELVKFRQDVGDKAEGTTKWKYRAQSSTGLSLDSMLDRLDSSLSSHFDKSIDYNVQSLQADKLDLLCYPQYNVVACVSVVRSAEADKEMKAMVAKEAFGSATSVLQNEMLQLTYGKPPLSQEELDRNFQYTDLDDPINMAEYEAARDGTAAVVDTPEKLQTLYGNLLALESEMEVFKQDIAENGDNILALEPDPENFADAAVRREMQGCKKAYKDALKEVKDMMQERARDMGVVLEEKRTPTLSDEIESIADERDRHFESSPGVSSGSDLGDDDERGSVGDSRDSEYGGSVSEYRDSSDLGGSVRDSSDFEERASFSDKGSNFGVVGLRGIDLSGLGGVSCKEVESKGSAVSPEIEGIESTQGHDEGRER
jgi:hypothetical protein